MINPTRDDIGRAVIYRDRGGAKPPEQGIITSFNDFYVFARYGTDSTSKGAHRRDLSWVPCDAELPERRDGESDRSYYRRVAAFIAGEDVRSRTDLRDWTGSLPFHLAPEKP